eukprot:CAMPEP_0119092902 /NCGR_PEP_ID=MMETSP1178-20130426/161337_1 /TAXON_ID=33656 /ORGANISM="unid sp, Strain CCMP2000" /LENGTH=58 /DNA_ID=CAMNT_0007076519 /DNA_START=80 /DNA_END=253 /DNA_ORIENTATION=+
MAADEGGWRQCVRHAAPLALGVFIPDVPVAQPFEGLDSELGTMRAMHLFAQGDRGRLV